MVWLENWNILENNNCAYKFIRYLSKFMLDGPKPRDIKETTVFGVL